MKIVIVLAVCVMLANADGTCAMFTCGTPEQTEGSDVKNCVGPNTKSEGNALATNNCGKSYSDLSH